MSVTYKKMSLFDAPEAAYIVHACNAKGVWGSGIAKQILDRYPKAFLAYKDLCLRAGDRAVGHAVQSHFIPEVQKHIVYNLITSVGYGSAKSSKEDILIYTTLAIEEMCKHVTELAIMNENIEDVYTCKINSGLFNVPWEETENIIKLMANRWPRVNWIVCDPDLQAT